MTKRELFSDLLGRHQIQVIGYIYALVHNLDDAEDIYQKTSLVLWNKFDQFDTQSSFFAWASQVARYEVMNFHRTRSARNRYFSESLMEAIAESRSPEVESEMEARRQALPICLEKLSPSDQELIDKCYADRQTIKQVAESIDRPPKSVYDSLSRIRGTLYDCVNRIVDKDRIP